MLGCLGAIKHDDAEISVQFVHTEPPNVEMSRKTLILLNMLFRNVRVLSVSTYWLVRVVSPGITMVLQKVDVRVSNID